MKMNVEKTGMKKMGMLALSMGLVGAIALSAIAATTTTPRDQVHTAREQVEAKIKALESGTLTAEQQALVDGIEAELKSARGDKVKIGFGGECSFGIELTDAQKEAIQDMTPDQVKAYLEANMTDEQKAAKATAEAERAAKEAEMLASMTDEQKAAYEARKAEMEKMRADWDSMSDEEKAAKKTEMKKAVKTSDAMPADADGNVFFSKDGHGKGGKHAGKMAVKGVALTDAQKEAMKSMSAEERKAYLEANLSDEQKAAMETAKTERSIHIFGVELTDAQKEAIKNLQVGELESWLDANLTAEQKTAMEKAKADKEAKRAEMEANMTDEQKAEMEKRNAEALAKYQDMLTRLNAIG